MIYRKPLLQGSTAVERLEELKRYIDTLVDQLNLASDEADLLATQIKTASEKEAADAIATANSNAEGLVNRAVSDYGDEFVMDTRTAAGAALKGNTKATELKDGMHIVYWLNYAAGTNSTLELTFPNGTTTGAIPCYYSGSTRLSTHYPAGNALHMVYREHGLIAGADQGAGWWVHADYDTNYSIAASAVRVDTAVYQYSLHAVTGTSGVAWSYNSFTQSAGTGTSKKATTKKYYPNKIYYYNGSSNKTTAGGTTGTTLSGGYEVDVRYSTNCNKTLTSYAPLFFVGSLDSNGLFSLKGNQATTGWWQNGVPATATTDVYWFVGINTSSYKCRLAHENPLYHFDNGIFKRFQP